MLDRTLTPQVDRLLRDFGKMIFLSGPRQVGKTTLAAMVADRRGGGQRFNWDVITDQKRLLKDPYFFAEHTAPEQRLVLFDEIHKYARWKNYLKGAYDLHGREYQFLVTGSGRLDLFRKGGDSLMGRYFAVPLFPLTVGELAGHLPPWSQFLALLKDGPAKASAPRSAYESLHDMGGFPEPFLRQEQSFYNLWSAERRALLIRQDVRDATRIREISLLQMLAHLLPERVGSPLSLNALREDLGVAFETVRDWVNVLAQFFYAFLVPPYTASLSRTLRKEQKAYLFDWAELEDPGARFENLVALHLRKAVDTWRSLGEGECSLSYIRDKEKREVDFVLLQRRRPVCLIEAKRADIQPSSHLMYFQDRLGLPAVQLVHAPGVLRRLRRGKHILWVASADRWLSCLP
jgi:predicted AAA+ superfamily ATPase